MYTCSGPWPFDLFFPVLFLFDWVGALWPQLSKVLKPVRWAGNIPFSPASLQRQVVCSLLWPVFMCSSQGRAYTVSWLVGVQIKVIATCDLWPFIRASNLLPSTPHPTPLQKQEWVLYMCQPVSCYDLGIIYICCCIRLFCYTNHKSSKLWSAKVLSRHISEHCFGSWTFLWSLTVHHNIAFFFLVPFLCVEKVIVYTSWLPLTSIGVGEGWWNSFIKVFENCFGSKTEKTALHLPLQICYKVIVWTLFVK